eukprot:4332756-Pleurochrysis_carterae.AAC.1
MHPRELSWFSPRACAQDGSILERQPQILHTVICICICCPSCLGYACSLTIRTYLRAIHLCSLHPRRAARLQFRFGVEMGRRLRARSKLGMHLRQNEQRRTTVPSTTRQPQARSEYTGRNSPAAW